MEWTIIAVNFLYAALSVVLMYASYRLIDLVTPTVDFAAELKNGNVAVAIFIAALLAWGTTGATSRRRGWPRVIECDGGGTVRRSAACGRFSATISS